MVEQISAAEVRAQLVRSARLHEARLLAGDQDAEESVEAEAGAILEAETAADIHDLRNMMKAWIEANSKS